VLKRLSIAVLLLILACPSWLVGQSQEQTSPDIGQLLMDKVLQRYKSEDVPRNKAGFTRQEVIEYYDSNWKFKSTRTEIKTIKPGQKEPGNFNIDIAGILATRYQFHIDDRANTKLINGITCAAVRFEPKPNIKISTSTDKITSRLSGTIYVNLDDFSMVMVDDISIDKPFGFIHWFYILPISINVSKLDLTVEFMKFNNVNVKKTVMLTIDATGYSKQKHTFTYSDYQ